MRYFKPSEQQLAKIFGCAIFFCLLMDPMRERDYIYYKKYVGDLGKG